MYLDVSVCHRLLSCVVRFRPFIVYLVPMQRIFIASDVRRAYNSSITAVCSH